ncbi:MAG: hypothetical protein JW769_01245, partial [Parachlamydiales bacterium]|nr:hypothetical protein [Parachlamydiales bacterium]
RKDLHHFNKDIHSLTHHQQLLKDPRFLEKISREIINLYEEAITVEKIFPKAHDIYHILATPFGAPFVNEQTLLQAAVDYSYQKPSRSEMKHTLEKFLHYNKNIHNELIDLFDYLTEEIESNQE